MQFEKKFIPTLVLIIGVLLTIFQIATASGFYLIDSILLRSCHLAGVFALTFLLYPAVTGRQEGALYSAGRILDVACVVVSLSVIWYFWTNYEVLTSRIPYIDELTDMDYVFGIITLLFTLEVTRRTSGLPLALVAAIGIAYAFAGPWLPGFLHHQGVSAEEFIEHIFVLQEGIFGIPLANAATIIFAFILFGAVMEKSGMNDLFLDMACYVTRNACGGPAKAAIFGSALFGSISGSAVANVYGTGNFTIPMMKQVGYRPHFAGAVEAVASTGGQIMPPVMGAAAFIMADITGVGYTGVLKAALIPAILYYASLYWMIHFEAKRYDVVGVPASMIPNFSRIKKRLYYLLAIIILIWLIVIGKSPIMAALIASLAMYILSFISRETRMSLADTVDTLVLAAKNTLMISSCCACAGIVVGVISLTGCGYALISSIASIAGDSQFILLLTMMLVCFVLGMGVPTAPAYILAASLGAPLLVKSGISLVGAHLFLLYFAVLSAITPPVCMASFAGAAVADANPMRTGFTSMRIGIVAFIVPYMFIYSPELLMEGSVVNIIWACITSFIGCILFAAGIQRYLLTSMTYEAVPSLVGGICLIYPGIVTDIIGAVCILTTIAVQIIKVRRR